MPFKGAGGVAVAGFEGIPVATGGTPALGAVGRGLAGGAAS